MRTILILGAGVMQLPAIRAARRLGLHTIVADGNENAVGRDEADEFVHVDLKDLDGLVEAAGRIKARRDLHAVFTAGTDFSSSVSRVADEFGLPAPSYDASMRATDKAIMRKTLSEAGVSVPRYVSLDRSGVDTLDTSRGVDGVSLPVVVKPVDSMGARGVVRGDDWTAVARLAADAIEFSRSGRIIIEEFIGGPEFSIDALVYGSEIRITGFADRHIRFEPFFIEVGHTLPTAIDPELRQTIENGFRNAVRALGLGPGAAKGDLKWWRERVYVGEVAARLSGGYMSGWTYPLASGVILTEHAIRIALGEPPGKMEPSLDRTSAERAVLSIPGVIAAISGESEVAASDSIEATFVNRTIGDRVVFPRNNVEKVCNVIATADSREDAVTAAESGVSRFRVRLAPNDDETNRFLFAANEDACADGRNGAHSAYEYVNILKPLTRAQLDSVRSTLPGARSAHVDVFVPADSVDRDWNFRTAQQSVDLAARETGAEILMTTAVPKEGSTCHVLSRALARGGAQGLVYAIDSISTSG